METLFQSESLIVRHVPGADDGRLIVTFDSLGHDPSLDRTGFGEAFCAAHGISAIHVLGAGNDWYQYPEMAEATAAIRAVTVGVPRVMAYGSSMGGYAALRLADAVGANAILAISPQYAIQPAIVPFEPRWTDHAARIAWTPEAFEPIRSLATPVVAYDPTGADGTHVALIDRDRPVLALPLPYVGHPATTFLADVGQLVPLVFAVLGDTLDPAAFLRTARAQRRASWAYCVALAISQLPQRPRLALVLADKALALGPANDIIRSTRGRALSLLGRHAEALAAFDEVEEDHISYAFLQAEALAAAGDIAASMALTQRLIARHPLAAHLHGWQGTLHWMRHEERAAYAALDRAMTLDPDSAHHRMSLAYYDEHRALRDHRWRWVGGAPVRRILHPTVRRVKAWFRARFGG